MKNEKFLAAVSTIIGTIIGVGIFGLPYAIAQAGFLIGALELIFLSAVVLILHLLYGEIILRTKKPQRFIGYTEKYLGKKAKHFAIISVIFGVYGSLLAYIIIGGEFMSGIFNPLFGGNIMIYSLIFYILMSLMVLTKIKTIGRLELIMSFFLLLTIFLILAFGFNKIQIQNLTTIHINKIFFPYGIVLFSLAGSAAIPLIREMLSGEENKIKKAIIAGTVIPAILYLFFILVVNGVSGNSVSSEALIGLSDFLNPGIIIIGRTFGLLAVATSFLVFGEYLEETFNYDLKFNGFFSYILAIGVPLIAFLSGIKNFIDIIGFLGVIFGGIEGILIILIFMKAKSLGDRKPEYILNIPKFASYGIIGIFILGIIYEFFFFI